MAETVKQSKFILGCIFTGITLLMLLGGIFYTPYDPMAMDGQILGKISADHIMGCDQFGRDVFSRVLVGVKETMIVAGAVVLIGTFFGTLVGMITGYFGGWLDEILMRLNDAVLAFPSVLLALLIIGLYGGGRNTLILALGIAFIPSFARIIRSEVLKIRNLDYIKSVRLYGAGHLRIIIVHILPNLKTVLLSSVLIGFNNAVLAEAGMSYLGMGVAPPNPSLGRMLSEAQAYIFTNPMSAVFPGITIVIMILGFSLLSGALEKG
ncbi:MAG: ABC transporter permease [Lachnospiraceae bacterium]|nr:ABC transporter permease [Lachnospiraceae bacterium]